MKGKERRRQKGGVDRFFTEWLASSLNVAHSNTRSTQTPFPSLPLPCSPALGTDLELILREIGQRAETRLASVHGADGSGEDAGEEVSGLNDLERLMAETGTRDRLRRSRGCRRSAINELGDQARGLR